MGVEQVKLSEIIAEQVSKSLLDNQDAITQGLADGLDWNDGWENSVSKLSINTLRLATRLSVQMTMTMLAEMGILTFTSEAYRPQLVVLEGGQSPSTSRSESTE